VKQVANRQAYPYNLFSKADQLFFSRLCALFRKRPIKGLETCSTSFDNNEPRARARSASSRSAMPCSSASSRPAAAHAQKQQQHAGACSSTHAALALQLEGKLRIIFYIIYTYTRARHLGAMGSTCSCVESPEPGNAPQSALILGQPCAFKVEGEPYRTGRVGPNCAAWPSLSTGNPYH
jgi:hypothetical protein